MSITTIAVVYAPEIVLTESEKAGEALLKFFRALGWNGEDFVDPSKIRTTKAVFDRLYDTIFERAPDPVGVGMLMVNSGPSVAEHIPAGQVWLYEGWITPATAQEGAMNIE